MAEMILEKVSYAYRNGDRQILNEVSCHFATGTISAVVGSSGSGKTTLLSLMAGLDLPQSGAIYIDGESLADLDLDAYRAEKVAMIFQAFNLFPLLSALENVSYPMEMKGMKQTKAEEKAIELLDSVGIDEATRNRYPSNLSGGEQQRVAIARALATGARFLLADEPTGNLDVATGERVIGILRRLAHEEGYCVVVVTHNLAIAAASDVVYRINDGGMER